MDDRGRVDYRGLKAHREPLDHFLETIGKLNPKLFESWDESNRIAFYLNAYNALTLQTIVDHYPIVKHGLFSSGGTGGIRDIPGAWNGIRHRVLGQDMTLDHIEHDILRKQFVEPGIHFALVCASKGCPALRREPYLGSRLDDQLSDQIRRFVADPAKFHVDGRRVYLSPLLKWYGEDFERDYWIHSSLPKRTNTPTRDQIILHVLLWYSGDKNHLLLDSPKPSFTIEYMDYDWSLNDQGGQE